jgi:hypothetical protein
MIRHLGETLDEFPGSANQTQCFMHTVNLIAKSILSPFEAQKTKDRSDFNNVAQAPTDSAEGHNMEEEYASDEEVDIEEDLEGWEEEFDTSLKPIRSMLLKVRLHFLSYLVILILLDPYHLTDTCYKATEIFFHHQELTNNPSARVVQDAFHSWPSQVHDASGCFNSLEFDLYRYELVHAEWQIAMELQEILMVSNASHSCHFC